MVTRDVIREANGELAIAKEEGGNWSPRHVHMLFSFLRSFVQDVGLSLFACDTHGVVCMYCRIFFYSKSTCDNLCQMSFNR